MWARYDFLGFLRHDSWDDHHGNEDTEQSAARHHHRFRIFSRSRGSLNSEDGESESGVANGRPSGVRPTRLDPPLTVAALRRSTACAPQPIQSRCAAFHARCGVETTASPWPCPWLPCSRTLTGISVCRGVQTRCLRATARIKGSGHRLRCRPSSLCAGVWACWCVHDSVGCRTNARPSHAFMAGAVWWQPWVPG